MHPEPTLAQAQAYECYRAAIPESITKIRHPSGDWNLTHNTNNWTYKAVAGPDYYLRKDGKKTVKTQCSGNGFDYGALKIDFVGHQDWCVHILPGTTEAVVSASYLSGYTVTADGKSCQSSKPWRPNRFPAGKWGPQHNTTHWTYSARPGPDVFLHKDGKRTLETQCKSAVQNAPSVGLGPLTYDPVYDYGTHVVDLQGNQDWCATPLPAKMSICYAAGADFVPRPITGPTPPIQPVNVESKTVQGRK